MRPPHFLFWATRPEHRHSCLCAQQAFSQLSLQGETGRNARLGHRLEVCIPSRMRLDRVSPYQSERNLRGLFQFKCAAIERHHFGNAAHFDLADIRAVT
jgi:hypothetical protein